MTEKIKLQNGCDLLEKSYLCGINNNVRLLLRLLVLVVICLKSLTFVVSITTTLAHILQHNML